MNVNQIPYRTIWPKRGSPHVIQIIDQRYLPHQFMIEDLTHLDETIRAIKDMHVRGAPLIGVTAAYGVYLALLHAPKNSSFDSYLNEALWKLRQARPTAVNLEWAVEEQRRVIDSVKSIDEKIKIAFEKANQMANSDVTTCEKIGEYGYRIIEQISRVKKGKVVNILTHCNAGWLACVDWGTATAPIYKAFGKKIALHVWVSETRPRNQGSSLTAWELSQQRVPHTVIADNAAGHLMQHGMVDLVIVGTDRTTSYGDVANKIGTYLKAVAAKENNIPFYVAVPSSSIDWKIKDAIKDIPIEERSADEVKSISGWCEGELKTVLLTSKESPAKNYAFDVTPAKFVTGLITERGIAKADHEDILRLFPEKTNELRDEGVIKFQCDWVKTGPLSGESIKEINDWRNRLYQLGLIGVYPDGIGFGNISIRAKGNQFIITGTQTGNIPELDENHYVRVSQFNIEENRVTCEGPVKASSECLTHAMLYTLSPDVGAIIHTHNQHLWNQLKGQVPTTSKEIPYGTPEMALEVKKLFRNSDVAQSKIFVMAGHEDGIVTFGKDLTEAANILLSFYENYSLKRKMS